MQVFSTSHRSTLLVWPWESEDHMGKCCGMSLQSGVRVSTRSTCGGSRCCRTAVGAWLSIDSSLSSARWTAAHGFVECRRNSSQGMSVNGNSGSTPSLPEKLSLLCRPGRSGGWKVVCRDSTFFNAVVCSRKGLRWDFAGAERVSLGGRWRYFFRARCGVPQHVLLGVLRKSVRC